MAGRRHNPSAADGARDFGLQAAAAGPDGPAAAQYADLPELLTTGRYPRFAACIAADGPPEPFDPETNFDRILNGLISR